MDGQHTEQTRLLERDINTISTRFDRHLEIYAANGKELAALKQEVASARDDLRRNSETLHDLSEDNTSLKLAVNGLVVKASIYSAVGTSILVTIAVYFIEKLLT